MQDVQGLGQGIYATSTLAERPISLSMHNFTSTQIKNGLNATNSGYQMFQTITLDEIVTSSHVEYAGYKAYYTL